MPPNGRKMESSKSVKEAIHSGHFMVSDIDDSEVHDEDESPSLVVHESDCDQESSPGPVQGYDFETACKETSKTYTFGPRSSHSISIDASLTKLFECMTLAYSGKLTSPRWKQFKGLKLRLKEKIRLNNMIWRAWHMQFILRLKPFVCQFASPLDIETHKKAEAIVIEGAYWKRRMTTITAEYKKWRLFCKDQFKLKPSQEADGMAMDLDYKWPPWPKDSFCSPGTMDDDFIMDFSDTLFSTLVPNQPFDFPNPREIAAKAGIADFIQPGLIQLQPSVDDFMDTFEPLHDFLNSRLPPLLEESIDHSNMQDILPASSEQQMAQTFGISQICNFSLPAAPSTGSSTPKSHPTRRLFSHHRAQQARLASSHSTKISPSATDKMIIDSLINTQGTNSALPQEDMPSLSQTSIQPHAQSLVHSDSVQSQVPCIPPASDLSIASVLQSTLQNSASTNRTHSPSVTFGASVMPQSEPSQNSKTERTSQSFQQTSVLSGISNQSSASLAPKQTSSLLQPVQSVRVPLSLPHQQAAGTSISKQSDSEPKNQKLPVFLTVDLGQPSRSLNQSSNIGAFNIPVHVANVMSAQMPSITQSQIGIVSAQSSPRIKSEQTINEFVCNRKISAKPSSCGVEPPVFRRHSYTTGQQIQSPTGIPSIDRSRMIAPILPATTTGGFVVPEVPSKQRTRSRSVSSPQCGSPKSIAQQQTQAVSLTNISVSPPPQMAFSPHSICGKPTVLASDTTPLSPGVTTSVTTNVLPQNAVLAQLLSSGHTKHDIGQSLSSVTTSTTAASTTAVTIIRSIPTLVTTTAHTFVISPVPLATVAGVSDFQRSLLVGAANQVFGGQSSSPCVLPSLSPSSPNSSVCSPSPVLATTSLDVNASSSKPLRPKSDEERIQYKEHRRVCHINAEQKRRCNIKNGFEALHHLLPPMSQNPNAKVSKAAMLQKAAEYTRTLKAERQQQQEEAEMLKQQIESLNQAISLYQNQLPATGVPVPCQRTNRMKEMFEDYVRHQTLQNWKFWIFSLILEPLLESYNNNVSTASVDEMCKTILAWLDQHCSLVSLRPGVLNSLRHLSTTTNILSDPSRMPEEATRAVTKKEPRH